MTNRIRSHLRMGRVMACALFAMTLCQVHAQSTQTELSQEAKRVEAERWLSSVLPQIQARSDIINATLQAFSSQLNRLPDPGVRANELALNLHRLSDPQLAKAADFSSLAELDDYVGTVIRTGFTTKTALGDEVNMVFVPIAPCRMADSRSSTGGKLQANVARAYRNFAAAGQGGSATCNLSSPPGLQSGTPSALALTVTATQAEGGGWLTLSPYGVPSSTSALNFVPGVDIANSTLVKAAGTGTYDFQVTPSANVHVIVDLLGFYVRSEPTALDCVTLTSASTVIPAGSSSTTISAPSCAAGYAQTATLCESFSRGAVLRDVVMSSCQYDQGATASTGLAHTRCCRVPGTTVGRF